MSDNENNPTPVSRTESRSVLSPEEYRRVHDIAVAAYEAATPTAYRYSALALRKAVDAALATTTEVKP